MSSYSDIDSDATGSFDDELDYESDQESYDESQEEEFDDDDDEGSFELSDEGVSVQNANVLSSYVVPSSNVISQVPSVPTFTPLPGSTAVQAAPTVGISGSSFPVVMETKSRRFHLRMAEPIRQALDPYRSYFQASKGREESYGWSFPPSQEANVRGVIYRIFTGELPPPDQLPRPTAEQLSINVNVSPPAPVGPQLEILPTQLVQPTTVVQSTPQVILGMTAPPAPRRRQRKTAVNEPAMLPSAVIQSLAPTTGLNLYQNVTIQPTVVLPSYNPTAPEPGESQELYQRRLTIYQYLISQGMSSSSADVMSRMRNNVDLYGVSYNPVAMNVLNQVLPNTQ